MSDRGYAQRDEVLTRLKMATALCSCFLIVEAIGGYIAGSLAVLSDAAHLFSDLAGFAVAIAANYLAQRPASDWHTYGLKRAESLAALLSMLSLLIVSLGLACEAITRLINGNYTEIDGPLMSLIAGIGVFVNLLLACILGEHHIHLPGADHSHDHDHGESCSGHGPARDRSVSVSNGSSCASHDHSHSHDHGNGHSHSYDHQSAEKGEQSRRCTEEDALLVKENAKSTGSHTHHKLESHSHQKRNSSRNVNLHAAYIHVLGDLAQSAAVLIAGLAIWYKPNWAIVDPIITLLFCIMVALSTIGVLRTSVSVLLEQVPHGVSVSEVCREISALPGVTNVHALHIWSISHGQPALSVHCSSVNPAQAMRDIHDICAERGIHHTTLQVQPEGLAPEEACVTCVDETNCACHSEK